MVFTIFILSFASASGQGAYTVVLNSEYKYEIPANVDIQTYDWKVYTNNLLTIEATASECTITPVTGESNSVMVKWLLEGDYYLTMDALGTNGCSNKKAWRYTVVSTPTIAFKNITSDDCADLDPQFATELVAMFNSGNVLPESQYPITVNYQVGSEPTQTATINFAENIMLNVLGITENEISNTTNHITIMSATTKFGGVLNVAGDKVHTRTIYALPAKPVITINN